MEEMLRADNITFSYTDDQHRAVDGLSLRVKRGEYVAVLGANGCGKSTLAKLLVHFYDINGGAIKLGGQDIRSMSLAALNEQISYVAQEQFLFNTSLLENIRLGKLTATDEEVLAAAEKAQCTEFLNRLEHGIHTMAGDGGKQLSGGERQRISIARAFLKNSPIILLDEATASLDVENETLIQTALSRLIADKTVLVIAHRMRTVAGADKIVVLSEGSVAEEGAPEKLMKQNGLYARMVKLQTESQNWELV